MSSWVTRSCASREGRAAAAHSSRCGAGHAGPANRGPASLYRDGVQVLRGNVPVAFPVPGGDGREQVLSPHPRSPEGLRARFDRRYPRTSALIGAVGLVVSAAPPPADVLTPPRRGPA